MSSPYKGLTAPDYTDAADAPFAFRQLIDSGPVARFANAAARDAAIPAPTPGNICYRLDTKVVEIYDASAPAGWRSVNPSVPPVHKHHSPLGTEADGITGVHGSKITNATIPTTGANDKLAPGAINITHMPSVLARKDLPYSGTYTQIFTPPVRVGNGNVNIPSLQIGVEDVGFYRTSLGALGIAYGNTPIFEFNGSAVGGFGSPGYNTNSGFSETTKVGFTWTGSADGGIVAAIRAAQPAAYFGRLSSGSVVDLRRSGVGVGSISVTSTGTAFNTSSDNRLKENIQDLTPEEAMSKIMALEPRTFDWKLDGSRGIGLIAQEAFPVYEEPVFVPDDPEEYQSIDYSKYVTLLIAAVQHLSGRVAALEAT